MSTLLPTCICHYDYTTTLAASIAIFILIVIIRIVLLLAAGQKSAVGDLPPCGVHMVSTVLKLFTCPFSWCVLPTWEPQHFVGTRTVALLRLEMILTKGRLAERFLH